MIARAIIIFCFVFSLSACHRMHFKKHPNVELKSVSGVGSDFSQWHHVGIWSLIEFSDPVSPRSRRCDDWESVTIQKGFLPGLVSALPYIGVLYSPWDAYMKCSTKDDVLFDRGEHEVPVKETSFRKKTVERKREKAKLSDVETLKKLRLLEKLKNEGLLTQKEYIKKKTEVINSSF